MFDTIGGTREEEPALPAATPAGVGLGVAVAVVYAGQLAIGATSTSGLVRAGAAYPTAYLDGAYWTLFTPTFLHIGLLHAGLNAWFLYASAPRVERILGSAATLVVFLSGAFVGEIVSALVGRSVSAGASGGAWGLLVAELMLVLIPALRGGLPAPATVGQSLQLVGLNAFISLLPGVDGLAHLGGGIGGALAVGLVWLAPRSARWLALTGFVVHAGALALALRVGRPWALDEPPAPNRTHSLLRGGLEVEAPGDLVTYSDLGRIGRSGWDPVTYAFMIMLSDQSHTVSEKVRNAYGAAHVKPVACGPACDAEELTGREGVRVLVWRQNIGAFTLIGMASAVDATRADLARMAAMPGTIRLTAKGAVDLAHELKDQGQLAAGLAMLERYERDTPDPRVENDLAWTYATGPIEVRDGSRAVLLAEIAVSAEPQNPDFVDTLAAAHAANGDPRRAFAFQERALTLRPEDPGMEDRLRQYQAALAAAP
jgi:rhomboid protease GluP